MKQLIVILSLASMSLLTACATVGPVGGALYANVQGPVDATANPRGPAHGEACATSYFGIVGVGDASISTAAKKGGVTRISHVDQHSNNILGYMTYCTHVWGSKGAAAATATATPATATPAAATKATAAE